MAKSSNGLGKFSGKVGSVVFSINNGQQTVRAYQPVVSNPKSIQQRLQRAKANLVGQLSSVVPWQILEGLGDNRRARRARFLRLALNATTSQPSESVPSGIIAKLPNDKFVFSEGPVTPTIQLSTPSVSAYALSCVLTQFPGAPSDEFLSSGALVVVVIKSTDGIYESTHYRFVDASEIVAATDQRLTVGFAHFNEGAFYADFYVAPFRTDDGSVLRARALSLFGTATDFNAQMVYNPSALPLVWGPSQLITSATFTPA